MNTLEEIDSINAIDEGDLAKFSAILWDSLLIKRIYKRESLIGYKEDMVEGVTYLLKKMFLNDALSKESKLHIINLLDKLNTQKEYLELIKSKISNKDIEAASERLSQKSQSAFDLK
jgi:hypothetical protein